MSPLKDSSRDVSPSPSPPPVILAPRRLDEAFCGFLADYLAEPDADERLVRYVTEHGVLNVFGDRLDRVNRLFVEGADMVKPWIRDGSRLKERLRDFPDIFRNLWPGEVELPTPSHLISPYPISFGSEFPKRKRHEEEEEEADDSSPGGQEEEEGEAGGPGPETVKRRRTESESDSDYTESESEEDRLSETESTMGEGSSEGEDDGQALSDPASEEPYPSPPDPHLAIAEPIIVGSDTDEEEEAVLTPSSMSSSGTAEPEPHLTLEEQEEHEEEKEVEGGEDDDGEGEEDEHGEGEGEAEDDAWLRPMHWARTGSVGRSRGYVRDFDPADTAWMDSQDPIPFPLPEHHLPSPSPEIQPDYTVPGPPAETVDADEQFRGVTWLRRDGWEWTEDTYYRGTRQPPLGVRLEHALNFLREEDVDRCREWEEKFGELEGWLDWLENEDESRMVERCGVLVGNMYRDARRKVRGHRLFEREKYGVVNWGEGIRSEGEVPLPKRGKRVGVRDMRAIQVGEPVEDEGSRRILVAKPERVHTQFPPADGIDDDESGGVNWFLKRLNTSEGAFWAVRPGHVTATGDVIDQDYLFRLENAAYEACTSPRGPPSRFKTDDGRGRLVLPSEGAVLPPPPEGEQTEVDARLRQHAIERGARRAALQEALRLFTNTEQTLATTELNRVVLVVEGSVLAAVRRDLDRNYQWQPAEIDWNTAPVARDKLETMPYTFLWRLHRKLLADLAEHVRKGVSEHNANTRSWVTVPKGTTYGGPFVWRMVDPDVQEQQDLLKECEAVFKAIVRTPKTMGEGEQSSLLGGVEQLARAAANSEFRMSGARGLPEEFQFTLPVGIAGRLATNVTREELKWLCFLTSNSTNEQILRSSGEKQPKLYEIFTTRLVKAMDDRRAGALFLEVDQWRTIEELLDVLNSGCDDSKSRVSFTPFQAKYFLERAQEQGLCRYEEDLMVYGRVARSIRGLEPQARIRFLATQNRRDGHQHLIPLYPGGITSFHQLPTIIANEPQLQRQRNFFYNLGVRLGLTIFRLQRGKEDWKKAKPLDTKVLWATLQTFRRAFHEAKKEYEAEWDSSSAEPSLNLARFVKNIDPSFWEKVATRIQQSIPDGDLKIQQETMAMEDAALGIIRHNIIKESNENLSMLGRGRCFNLKEPDGTNKIGWRRDHNWDWASVEVRGKAKQFFSLDRWPLELLSEETRAQIKRDDFIDQKLILDPVAEDPIPRKYFRERLRRFHEDANFYHRPGPARYPIGDTPLQRKMVREMLVESISRATGVQATGDEATERRQTWRGRIADMLSLRQPTTPNDHDMAETTLPEVDASLVPRSWTPPAHAPGGDMEAQGSVVRSIEDDNDVHMDEA